MYIKPLILDSDELSEGVFTASGSSTESNCYSTSAYIHQSPEIGRGDYRIQVNAQHNGDHTKDTQYLTISFSQPVVFKSANGALMSGNNTNTIVIQLFYHQNPTDNIGMGDVIVEADPGLTITNIKMTD